jgi:hypothetical protein
VIVTLFASIVNLIVDCLFIDILSAPTADSLKVSSEETVISKTLRRVSNVNLGQMKSSNPAKSSRTPAPPFSPTATSTTAIPLARSKSAKGLLLSHVSTRIVPPDLADAHSLAMKTFHDIMGTTQQEVEKVCEARQSQRLQRMSLIKSRDSFIAGSRSGGVTADDDVRPASPLGVDVGVSSLAVGVSVGDLFETLKEEIFEERSMIRRAHEKDAFDSLWG